MKCSKDAGLPDRRQQRVPGEHLEPPTVPAAVPEELFVPSKANVAFWALITALAANAQAQRLGLETKGIVMEAPQNSDAAYETVLRLARALSLPVYAEAEPDLARIDVGHMLPPVIDARHMTPATLSRYLFDPRPKATLLVVSDLHAWQKLGLGGWLSITGVTGASDPVDAAWAAPALFTVLHHLGRVAPEQSRPLDVDWLAKMVTTRMPGETRQNDPNRRHLTEAVRQALGGDKQWTSSPADRALSVLGYMLRLEDNLDELRIQNEQVSLPAGRLLTELNGLMHLDLKLVDLRRCLLDAGLLKGAPGRRVVIPHAAWQRALDQHEQLLPV